MGGTGGRVPEAQASGLRGTYAELAKRLKKHGLKGNRGQHYEQAETGHIPGHVLFGRACGPGIGWCGAR